MIQYSWPKSLDVLWNKYRTGWRNCGIPDEAGESVAMHSFKVSNAALLYAMNKPYLDADKMALMGLFHDAPEWLAPDFTPGEVTPEEKHRIEREALEKLVEIEGSKVHFIRDLWLEYEARKTPEADAVFQLDKLDPSVQALGYEQAWPVVRRFYPYTRRHLADPMLVKTFGILMEKRYPNIEPYSQYFALLRNNADEEKFHLEMSSRAS